MTANYTRYMKQTATYWAVASTDVYGKRTFTAPQSLACRWEDRTELIRNKKGAEIVSKSRIFLESAVDIDGFLYKGTSEETDPTTLEGAYEVQMISQQPSLRNLQQLNVAYL